MPPWAEARAAKPPGRGPDSDADGESGRLALGGDRDVGHPGAMPEDVEGRFRSHHNYVDSFCWIAGRTPFTKTNAALQAIADAVAQSGLSDQPPASIDYEQVHRSLRNAWSTEVLLGLPGEWAADQDEFIRLANTWGVVQSYYVGYHVTQALIVAKGRPRPTTHPQTQTQYADLWADRPLALPPWTFGARHGGWRNLPAGLTLDAGIHPWTGCSPATCWSLASKALQTTREAQVKKATDAKRDEKRRDRKKAWQAEEDSRIAKGRKPRKAPSSSRPRLTAAEKVACDQRVRTYTILDYLYRLRIGANYHDASVFTDGPDNEHDSFLLHRRLGFLVSGLSLVAELRIRDLVGASHLHQWADDFAASNIPASYSLGIKERRPLL